MLFSKEGRGAHTVFSLYRVPEESSALSIVPSYHSICFTSMVDFSVIYLPFVYSPKVLQSTANQSALEPYWSKWKPEEDRSFTQRMPEINTQELKQNGLQALFLSEF